MSTPGPHWAARPCVIGICGPEGTGKDTTAEGLLPWFRHHTAEARIDKFAAPLYQTISALTGLSVEWLSHPNNKDTIWTVETAPVPSLVGWSPRMLLRDVGMWVRDKVSPSHWAHLLKKRTTQGTAEYKSWYLVTDLRFVSELSAVSFVLEVRREGVEYKNDHPSSTRLPGETIDHTEWLKPGMDYAAFGQRLTTMIAMTVKKKQEAVS